MIRFKNNVLPVWIQWDGDEASLERAKQTIIDDIVANGLNHYTGYVDVLAPIAESDTNWDGNTPEPTTKDTIDTKEKTTKKEAPKKSKKNKGLPKGDFISEKEPSTDFDTSKTAS
tara:strand:- start:20 stop:364 length:345 start_codon:yes stop_codon:yes gene_type:complete